MEGHQSSNQAKAKAKAIDMFCTPFAHSNDILAASDESQGQRYNKIC